MQALNRVYSARKRISRKAQLLFHSLTFFEPFITIEIEGQIERLSMTENIPVHAQVNCHFVNALIPKIVAVYRLNKLL